MSAISLIITDAGRAEVINADNTGTGPVTLTEVAFGTGTADSAPEQLALQSEFKRLSTISGLVVADDTIHVTVRDESNDAYSFSEFGIFTDSGTLFAVYSAPSAIMQKAAASSLNMALDIVLGTLDVNTVTFGDTNFANPPASETVAGVAKVATQTDTDTGTDDTKFITPKKLKAWVKQATETVFGLVKLSSSAQALAGTDTLTAMSPDRVHKAFKQFGIGTSGETRTRPADLNSVTKAGFYSCSGGTVNGPSVFGGVAFGLIHQDWDSSLETAIQIAVSVTTGMMARRTKTLGSWTPWVLIADTLNMSSSLTANGYQKLPSGLIIQWGTYYTGVFDGTKDYTLPIAFPSQFLSISFAHSIPTTSGNNTISVWPYNSSTFRADRADANEGDMTFTIIAVGY